MKTKSLFSLWAISSLLGSALAVCSRQAFESCMATHDFEGRRRHCDTLTSGPCLGSYCGKSACVNKVRQESWHANIKCSEAMCAGDVTCVQKTGILLNGPSCTIAHCGFGNGGIDCWDSARRQCTEALAAGSSTLCDPCQPASDSCLAQALTNKTNQVNSCISQFAGAPTAPELCNLLAGGAYATAQGLCTTKCMADCKANLPPPGTPYTCANAHP
jgi:hypothetical protein